MALAVNGLLTFAAETKLSAFTYLLATPIKSMRTTIAAQVSVLGRFQCFLIPHHKPPRSTESNRKDLIRSDLKA
jgi:hypothetical protein